MMTNSPKIKVVGLGGAGGNAISRITKYGIKGIELIAINSDIQDLKATKCPTKIQIGQKLTHGLGTGMEPKIGRLAALESQKAIEEALKDASVVFITAGLGGGTGSGAAPIVAQIARNFGALTIAIVSLPFSFEGSQRKRIAKTALNTLKEQVNTIITIKNDKILNQADNNTSVLNAFWAADETLRLAVQGLADLIVVPGIINVDFSDIKTIMEEGGWAAFGIGQGKGEKRAEIAARAAIKSPFLDIIPKAAKGLLFNITGPANLRLEEVQKAAEIVTTIAANNAKIIFGAIQSQKIKRDEIKITLIATGIEKPSS